MNWWKVKPPEDPEFYVLVAKERVAAYTRNYDLIELGDRWEVARKTLEKEGFKCVMEGGT